MSVIELPEETQVIVLNSADNVAVARDKIPGGRRIGIEDIQASVDIPRGHKLALRPIQVGEAILKYGQVIGFATQPIQAGEHVHLQNMAMQESNVAHEFCAD